MPVSYQKGCSIYCYFYFNHFHPLIDFEVIGLIERDKKIKV